MTDTPTKIICIACKSTFEFSEKDREFFEIKGWSNPIRCKPCREKRRIEREKYEGLRSTMNNNDKARCKSRPRSSATKMFDGYRM